MDPENNEPMEQDALPVANVDAPEQVVASNVEQEGKMDLDKSMDEVRFDKFASEKPCTSAQAKAQDIEIDLDDSDPELQDIKDYVAKGGDKSVAESLFKKYQRKQQEKFYSTSSGYGTAGKSHYVSQLEKTVAYTRASCQSKAIESQRPRRNTDNMEVEQTLPSGTSTPENTPRANRYANRYDDLTQVEQTHQVEHTHQVEQTSQVEHTSPNTQALRMNNDKGYLKYKFEFYRYRRGYDRNGLMDPELMRGYTSDPLDSINLDEQKIRDREGNEKFNNGHKYIPSYPGEDNSGKVARPTTFYAKVLLYSTINRPGVREALEARELEEQSINAIIQNYFKANKKGSNANEYEDMLSQARQTRSDLKAIYAKLKGKMERNLDTQWLGEEYEQFLLKINDVISILNQKLAELNEENRQSTTGRNYSRSFNEVDPKYLDKFDGTDSHEYPRWRLGIEQNVLANEEQGMTQAHMARIIRATLRGEARKQASTVGLVGNRPADALIQHLDQIYSYPAQTLTHYIRQMFYADNLTTHPDASEILSNFYGARDHIMKLAEALKFDVLDAFEATALISTMPQRMRERWEEMYEAKVKDPRRNTPTTEDVLTFLKNWSINKEHKKDSKFYAASSTKSSPSFYNEGHSSYSKSNYSETEPPRDYGGGRYMSASQIAKIDENARVRHESRRDQSPRNQSKRSKSKHRDNSREKSRPRDSSTHRTHFEHDPNTRCKFCKGPHILRRCEEFMSKSPEGRKHALNDKGICVRCLGEIGDYHTDEQCNAWFCNVRMPDGGRCNQGHSDVVHDPRINTTSRRLTDEERERIRVRNEKWEGTCITYKRNKKFQDYNNRYLKYAPDSPIISGEMLLSVSIGSRASDKSTTFFVKGSAKFDKKTLLSLNEFGFDKKFISVNRQSESDVIFAVRLFKRITLPNDERLEISAEIFPDPMPMSNANFDAQKPKNRELNRRLHELKVDNNIVTQDKLGILELLTCGSAKLVEKPIDLDLSKIIWPTKTLALPTISLSSKSSPNVSLSSQSLQTVAQMPYLRELPSPDASPSKSILKIRKPTTPKKIPILKEPVIISPKRVLFSEKLEQVHLIKRIKLSDESEKNSDKNAASITGGSFEETTTLKNKLPLNNDLEVSPDFSESQADSFLNLLNALSSKLCFEDSHVQREIVVPMAKVNETTDKTYLTSIGLLNKLSCRTPEIVQNDSSKNNQNFLTASAMGEEERLKGYIFQTKAKKPWVKQVEQEKLNCSMLCTAIANVAIEGKQKCVEARLLLDVGSQLDLIDEEFCRENSIKIHSGETFASVNGVTGVPQPINAYVKIKLLTTLNSNPSEKNNGCFSQEMTLAVVPQLFRSVPNEFIDISHWDIPSSLHLADPNFNFPGPVHILVGADVFWSVFENTITMKLPSNANLRFQSSVFGWVPTKLYKKCPQLLPHTSSASNYCIVVAPDMPKAKNNVLRELNKNLEKFWEQEEKPLSKLWSAEEEECERHFLATTKVDASGSYVIIYPKNHVNLKRLGDSYNQAKKRIHNTLARLDKKPDLKVQYCKFMQDYEELGHMVEIKDPGKWEPGTYYIPHSPIIKDTSTSTKCRIVFDASAKTSTKVCLNDALLIGPAIQPELYQILIRFREKRYVFVTDIRRMFRCIKTTPDDNKLQRIFWRRPHEQKISVFELQTVTYGTASAPYVAQRSLTYLADELEKAKKYELAIKPLKEAFYMDDCCFGDDDLEKAIECRKQLAEALASRNMQLAKWCSNDVRLLEGLTPDLIESQFPLAEDERPAIKTLGLIWLPTVDVFKIYLHLGDVETANSKRRVLSTISKLFDPMGFLGPVVFKAKLFMQTLWREHKDLKWDTILDESFTDEWFPFAKQLNNLNKIAIPRYFFSDVGNERQNSYILVGFCDASEKGFGACIYLRSVANDGKIGSSLISCKSRVAPLKAKLTIPRLELEAALLLGELMTKIRGTISLDITGLYCFSDSKTVLGWLNSPAKSWKVFVANRVQETQRMTQDCNWGYVGTDDNPADCLSRGIDPDELLEHNLWWKGAPWVTSELSTWPESKKLEIAKLDDSVLKNENCIPELKQEQTASKNIVIVSGATGCEQSDEHKPKLSKSGIFGNHVISESRTWPSMINKTACLKRILRNLRTPEIKKEPKPILEAWELKEAELQILKDVQISSFPECYEAVKNNKELPKNSKLKGLNPVWDADKELVRMDGRLGEVMELDYHRRYPVILLGGHYTSSYIIEHIHLKYLHANIQQLICEIRSEGYWIVGIRKVCKSVINKCVTCLRYRGLTHQQVMGYLPPSRARAPARAFYIVGVDYCGPFNLAIMGAPRRSSHKAWICVFVCYATKAIDLEVVSDMTSDTFIAALQRFSARRGTPHEINSDNGTNFVGADAMLANWFANLELEMPEPVNKYLQANSIKWKFIPPGSPHMGGIWEAAVKSIKYHLKRVIGNARFNFEEYSTICSQIAACVNKRPLINLSESPDEINVLTPGHFLGIFDSCTLPIPPEESGGYNLRHRWARVNTYLEEIWRRWSEEYLATLQERSKWFKKQRNFQVDDIVIVKNNLLPPSQYALGKISEVFPDKHGIVRKCKLKMCKGKHLDNKKGGYVIDTTEGVMRKTSDLIWLPIYENVDAKLGEKIEQSEQVKKKDHKGHVAGCCKVKFCQSEFVEPDPSARVKIGPENTEELFESFSHAWWFGKK